MCNDYGNRIPATEYVEEFSQTKIPFTWADGRVPNLEPRDEIWPSEKAPVIRPAGDGVELAQLTWGLPPSRP